MDRLQAAIDSQSREIEASLSAAYEEREQLSTRVAELTELINRAEAALGLRTPSRRMTLHDAIAHVLSSENGAWMHVKKIASEVNTKGLYYKTDGSAVEPNQVHARTTNYDHMFEKEGPMIRLRDPNETFKDRPRGPSKYDPLAEHLLGQLGPLVTMTFESIEDLVGRLPASAHKHQAWWANESGGSHVQAHAWMRAGWEVDSLDQTEGWVSFRRRERGV